MGKVGSRKMNGDTFIPNRSLRLDDVESIDGEFLSGHMWVRMTRVLQQFKPGDVITFSAQVRAYTKGVHPNQDHGRIAPAIDYQFCFIQQVALASDKPRKRQRKKEFPEE